MNLFLRLRVATLAMFLVTTTFVVADEPEGKKKKKGRSPVANVLRQIKQNEIELTAEQKEKIETLGKDARPKLAEVREQHDLSPAFEKQVAAARQEARQMNKKGEEIEAHAMESVDASEKQKAGLAKISQMQSELLRSALAVLTEEQREKLPKRLSRVLKQKNAA